jgi:hypothetical protein
MTQESRVRIPPPIRSMGTHGSTHWRRPQKMPLCMESSTPWRDTAWAMSEENVEIVRRVLDGFTHSDRDGVEPLLQPDVKWRTVAGPLLGAETVSGREAMLRFASRRQRCPERADRGTALMGAGVAILGTALTLVLAAKRAGFHGRVSSE